MSLTLRSSLSTFDTEGRSLCLWYAGRSPLERKVKSPQVALVHWFIVRINSYISTNNLEPQGITKYVLSSTDDILPQLQVTTNHKNLSILKTHSFLFFFLVTHNLLLITCICNSLCFILLRATFIRYLLLFSNRRPILLVFLLIMQKEPFNFRPIIYSSPLLKILHDDQT